MRRISILAFITIVVLVTLLTSCEDSVTPVAYTRVDVAEGLDVEYTTNMYFKQIMVYDGEDTVMTFSFTRCTGHDVLGGKDYTLVDLTDTPYLDVFVYGIYEDSKHFYLNGELLEATVSADGVNAGYHIDTIDNFIRTNPNGQIDENKVNVIEYR